MSPTNPHVRPPQLAKSTVNSTMKEDNRSQKPTTVLSASQNQNRNQNHHPSRAPKCEDVLLHGQTRLSQGHPGSGSILVHPHRESNIPETNMQ